MAVPTTDTRLVPWGAQFLAGVTSAPTTFGLSAAMVTQMQGLYDTYVAANEAVTQAREQGIPQTEARRTARDSLIAYARRLYKVVQGFPGLSPEQLTSLGVHVADVEPTPVPPPSSAPQMVVVWAVGNLVRVRLHNAELEGSRARPPGTIGATILSHVGEIAPAELKNWKLEGSTGSTTVDVVFPATLPPGTKVWISAYWFNYRKQAGPMAQAISAYLPGGAIQQAA
jgi:hypothetical protein